MKYKIYDKPWKKTCAVTNLLQLPGDLESPVLSSAAKALDSLLILATNKAATYANNRPEQCSESGTKHKQTFILERNKLGIHNKFACNKLESVTPIYL